MNRIGIIAMSVGMVAAQPCFGQFTVQSFGPATWNANPAVIDATTGMVGATFETFEDFSLDPNLSVSYNSNPPSLDITYDSMKDPRWDGNVGFSLVLPGTPVTTCMAERLEVNLSQPSYRIGFGISLMEIGPGGPSPHPTLIINGQELVDFIDFPNYVDGGLQRNVYVVVTADPGNSISSFGIANPKNCDRVMMDRIGWFACGTGQDCDNNGIPDACELDGHDCNGNAVLDSCDIANNTSQDCNANEVPDECDLLQTSWQLRSTTGPSPRSLPGMVYDSARDVIVLFGGGTDTAGIFDDTWEWDGATWLLRATAGPTPEGVAAMAYDAARNVTILTGAANGIWHWDGNNWTYQGTAPFPSRRFMCMTYDSARQRVVLFGGEANGSTGVPPVSLNDTWEWDGTNWSLRSSTGPSPRNAYGMAFDSQRNKTVLFGGGTNQGLFGDTWEWDGSTWVLRATTGPSPRGYAAMTFDSSRGKVVLFGGGASDTTYHNDTWEWDGNQWQLISVAGPAAWGGHRIVFDSQRGVSMLFGGASYFPSYHVNGQTWVYGLLADCNGNGVLDSCDIAEGFSQDCNQNGIPDSCDLVNGTSNDCNNNSVLDSCDIDSGTSYDCNQDQIPDECQPVLDADGDGIQDGCDNCPAVVNPDQANNDNDAFGNACDNCPNTFNLTQIDSDGDGLGDLCDNCPGVVNPGQEDCDNDGYGDACGCSAERGDMNGDGLVNAQDTQLFVERLLRP